MFTKFILDLPSDSFKQLSESIQFEDIINGRTGANLIDYKNGLIPLIRTTTIYNKPNQKFLPVHYSLIDNIKKVVNYDNLEFNNALMEMYSHSYYKMGFHIDQTLDLDENSYICLFTCYNNPETKYLRKLKIKNKTTNECSDIVLDHNSFVIFSTDTNKKYLHKIILENPQPENKEIWSGITFRKSKTFIFFNKITPRFYSNNEILVLANNDNKKEFYKLRSMENTNTDYIYPKINYTISTGDIIPVV
jgi:hypothetical protein